MLAPPSSTTAATATTTHNLAKCQDSRPGPQDQLIAPLGHQVSAPVSRPEAIRQGSKQNASASHNALRDASTKGRKHIRFRDDDDPAEKDFSRLALLTPISQRAQARACLRKFRDHIECPGCHMVGTLRPAGSKHNGAPAARCSICNRSVSGQLLLNLLSMTVSDGEANARLIAALATCPSPPRSQNGPSTPPTQHSAPYPAVAEAPHTPVGRTSTPTPLPDSVALALSQDKPTPLSLSEEDIRQLQILADNRLSEIIALRSRVNTLESQVRTLQGSPESPVTRPAARRLDFEDGLLAVVRKKKSTKQRKEQVPTTGTSPVAETAPPSNPTRTTPAAARHQLH